MADMNEVQKRILALQRERRERQQALANAPIPHPVMTCLVAQLILGTRRYSAAQIQMVMDGGINEFLCITTQRLDD